MPDAEICDGVECQNIKTGKRLAIRNARNFGNIFWRTIQFIRNAVFQIGKGGVAAFFIGFSADLVFTRCRKGIVRVALQ